MRMREITAFARSYEYDGAHWTNVRFNGYKVYKPYFFDGRVRYVGHPKFILVKGRSIRMVCDRSLKIFRLLYQSELDFDDEENA